MLLTHPALPIEHKKRLQPQVALRAFLGVEGGQKANSEWGSQRGRRSRDRDNDSEEGEWWHGFFYKGHSTCSNSGTVSHLMAGDDDMAFDLSC